jgi:hypothetical protein
VCGSHDTASLYLDIVRKHRQRHLEWLTRQWPALATFAAAHKIPVRADECRPLSDAMN